jgi:all-trans-8'-apo-beta-carotenal 15,15'-oxygenase
MTTAAIREDYAPGLDIAFAPAIREGSCLVDDIRGDIPPFVRGTLLMNGPGRFDRGSIRYSHWLDGDGLLCALRIADDGVRVTTRYVRSRKFVEEDAAGQPLFRTFGTTFARDRLYRGLGLESPVNVSVFPYANRLLAFGEQGLPWDIDPATLDTRGVFTFGGALNDVSPFSAHPKIDGRTGELFNFGVSFAARQPALHVYRFGTDPGSSYRRRIPLPFSCSIHDFSLCSRHLLFHISPYIVDVDRLIRGGTTLLDALSWQPHRGSRVWIVERSSGRLLHEIDVPPRYVLHHLGCMDVGSDIALDVIELEEPVYPQYVIDTFFASVAPGKAVRLIIDPDRGTLVDRREAGYAGAPDFPTTDASSPGATYRRAWMLGMSNCGRTGRKFFDELVAIDWREPTRASVYRAPSGSYLAGEPTFVADPHDAHGGVVLCPMLDAAGNRTVFGVFDARAVEKGPVAQLIVRPALHLLFHGVFAAPRVHHA